MTSLSELITALIRMEKKHGDMEVLVRMDSEIGGAWRNIIDANLVNGSRGGDRELDSKRVCLLTITG